MRSLTRVGWLLLLAVNTLSAQTAAPVFQPVSFTNSLGVKFVSVPGTDILFSVWDVRVRDYQAFVTATGRTWPKPIFKQAPDHPAINVSWNDAHEFCAWLTAKEQREGKLQPGEKYRLPSDAEWSSAVGLAAEAGTTPRDKDGNFQNRYPWGLEWPPPPGAGNYHPGLKGENFDHTSPVGSFAANQNGLLDAGGNVWQWCEDEFTPGSSYRVLRGGSWASRNHDSIRSSRRFLLRPEAWRDDAGFRPVLAGASAR